MWLFEKCKTNKRVIKRHDELVLSQLTTFRYVVVFRCMRRKGKVLNAMRSKESLKLAKLNSSIREKGSDNGFKIVLNNKLNVNKNKKYI